MGLTPADASCLLCFAEFETSKEALEAGTAICPKCATSAVVADRDGIGDQNGYVDWKGTDDE